MTGARPSLAAPMLAPGAGSRVLSARGLTKAYHGNVVLREVDIDVAPGTVHALLGENGAGKSTLINIVSGNVRPDAGVITLDGRDHTALTPALAHEHGIAVVHQELSLIPHLSVAENVALGMIPRRAGLFDYEALADRVGATFARLELDLPLDLPVHRLPLGTRQLLEIAKALHREPRLLILDEPTSSLTGVEVATLKRVLHQLRDGGIAILFISHRLHEVLELCDWVTILKDGVRTASQKLANASEQELVRLMVGRDPGDLFPTFESHASARPVLRVTALRSQVLQDVDLELAEGEILGIGGLLGQGQEELLLALFGAHEHRADRFEVGGVARPPSGPEDAIAAGIGYIPADRKVEALHLDQPLAFNLTLAAARRLARRGIRRLGLEARTIAELMRRFGVRGAAPRDPAIQLSGGNQQKVAIAKWLALEPRILLLNDPTRGIDVETKREIYQLLQRLAAQGTAVVLFSSDTPELVHLCDRVLVMFEGRVHVVLERAQLSEEAIVRAAVGVRHSDDRAAAMTDDAA